MFCHNCGRIWRACRVVPHARGALARLTPAAGVPFEKGEGYPMGPQWHEPH